MPPAHPQCGPAATPKGQRLQRTNRCKGKRFLSKGITFFKFLKCNIVFLIFSMLSLMFSKDICDLYSGVLSDFS